MSSHNSASLITPKTKLLQPGSYTSAAPLSRNHSNPGTTQSEDDNKNKELKIGR